MGLSSTRRLSSPTTIGSDRTLPDVWSKRTTRNGGPEPAKRATNPRWVLPQRDPPARKVPRSGPTSQPKGRLNPSDSNQKSPCPCHGPHGFLGADDTRALNSDKPGAPAASAGEGIFLLKLEVSFRNVTHCLTTRRIGSFPFQSAAFR
jgi:hypothetical protein